MIIVSLILSAVLLNVILYFVFKSFLLRTSSAGMKFLLLNIAKDVVWLLFWLNVLERTPLHFWSLSMVFLLTSFVLYFKVIRLLNKS